MKKSVKFFAMLLAAVMLVQIAPLSVLGDSAVDGSQNTVQSHNDLTQPQAPAINVTAIQWKDLSANSDYVDFVSGDTLSANHIRILFALSDTPTAIEIDVDGYILDHVLENGQAYVNVELLNGAHTATVRVYNGKTVTTKTVGFSISGEATYPEMNIEVPDSINLGETKTFAVTGNNMDSVEAVTVKFSITKGVKLLSVVICDGVAGSYSWYKGELTFSLRVVDPSAIVDGKLALVEVNAPIDLDTEQEITWTVDEAEIVLKEDSTVGKTDDFMDSFDIPDVSITIGTSYDIESSGQGTVDDPYTVVVKDQEGNPAPGVSVYVQDGDEKVLIGVTDENGEVTTDKLSDKGNYTIQAVSPDGLATEPHDVTIFDYAGEADGTPYAIHTTGLAGGGKNVVWMSHYTGSAETAQLLLSTSADMSDAVLCNGTSTAATYKTSLTMNRINTVSLTDLTVGAVYYYQVGDGTTWSEVKSFAVKEASDTVNIAVLGDLTGATAKTELLANAIAGNGVDYDFALRVGALATDMGDHDELDGKLAALNALVDLDTLHIANSTELNDGISGPLFGIDAEYAAYVYGNVFVAVLHTTDDDAALKANLTQMGIDAKNSGTEWQILVIREAPYTTDDPTTVTEGLETYVPTLCEQSGIDLVLSSVACNFARTESLRNGEMTVENGVTYLICGSADQKDAIVNTDSFAVTSDSYNALYVSVSVTDDELTVQVYDVRDDGTATVIDEITKTYFVCKDDEHLYRFGQSNKDDIICEICDHTRSLDDYTGVLAMSNYFVYFRSDYFGFVSGWQNQGSKVFFFDREIYLAVDGEQVIDGYTYVFKNCILVEGAWIEEDGVRKLMWAGELLKDTWHTQAGVTYYFLEDGTMATGTVEIPTVNENGETVTETYLFDENGALIGKQ